MPARVQSKQVKLLAQALREGTPNRNRIALQMVKDVLDESSFDASPGHFVPNAIGRAAARVADKLRDRSDADHPE
jgi:pyruvate dehydrogenase (quinone)/pyruvate oxidase